MNLSFDFCWNEPKMKRKILKDIIIDRKSKYTAILGFVDSKEEVDKFLKDILKEKYFQKATHNSFAFRIKSENGSILEWKNDDWETGAWMCILRELQREDYVNSIIIVTRFFGWIYLQNDRFKNVINASKEILNIDKLWK